jgi:hypothetical protein
MQSLDTANAERPWSKGVPEDHQKQANERFVAANGLLDESSFREAAAAFGEALKLWDHPSIHYNLALVLDILNDPIAMREHLVAAMRFGMDPLGEVRWKYATRMLQKLEQQVASIDITCNVQGAVIKLDHQEKFRGPGHYQGYVLPGDHVIEGDRLGFDPIEQHRTLLPGKPTKVVVQFYTDEQLTEKHSRWPFWIPVTVTAGGAALLGVGGLLLAHSNSKLSQFDSQINTRADCTSGCTPTGDLADLRSTGNHYKTAAAITFSAGGAAFAGGVIMMILDIPSSKRLTPEEYERKLQLQPSFGSGYAGMAGTAHF